MGDNNGAFTLGGKEFHYVSDYVPKGKVCRDCLYWQGERNYDVQISQENRRGHCYYNPRVEKRNASYKACHEFELIS